MMLYIFAWRRPVYISPADSRNCRSICALPIEGDRGGFIRIPSSADGTLARLANGATHREKLGYMNIIYLAQFLRLVYIILLVRLSHTKEIVDFDAPKLSRPWPTII